MLQLYDLKMLSEAEHKYLFTVFYISIVQSKKIGAMLQSFIRAVFEEIRDIIHDVQNYEQKTNDLKLVRIAESSGYSNTVKAVIKYRYNKKLKKNEIDSIFVQ